MMHVILKIGKQYFDIEQPIELPWTQEAARFRADAVPEDAEQVFYGCIDLVSEFAPIWGRILHADEGLTVMRADGKELRVFYPAGGGDPYAISWIEDNKHIRILVGVDAAFKLRWGRGMLNMLPLEHLCLQADSFLLHASYIIHQGEAIVFTAPSGTGKSTQADLWKAHENARVINGDRTLLAYHNGGWYACGFPISGSSPYCLNEAAPLRAIVCLGQAKQNTAEQLTSLPAVQRIYSQAFINTWNTEDISKAIDLIQLLSKSVPIWKYNCTKEADAVESLREKIYTLE